MQVSALHDVSSQILGLLLGWNLRDGASTVLVIDTAVSLQFRGDWGQAAHHLRASPGGTAPRMMAGFQEGAPKSEHSKRLTRKSSKNLISEVPKQLLPPHCIGQASPKTARKTAITGGVKITSSDIFITQSNRNLNQKTSKTYRKKTTKAY